MKRSHLLTAILTIIVVGLTIHGAFAQTSISGDSLCGKDSGTECTVANFVQVVKGAVGLIIILGIPVLLCFVSYRFVIAWFAREQGAATAYQDALKKSANAILGFLIIVLLMAGALSALLRYVGVKENGGSNPLKVLDLFSEAPTLYVMHAHADEGDACSSNGSFGSEDASGNCVTSGGGSSNTSGGGNQTSSGDSGTSGSGNQGTTGGTNGATSGTGNQGTASGATGGTSGAGNQGSSGPTGQLLPNFLSANSLYDFLLAVVRLFMRFVYLALIVMWVWTGFAFVQAQGSPEGINKAKQWLWRAFVSTLVIFMLQTFLTALKGTVEKILPGSTTNTATTQTQNPTDAGAGRGLAGEGGSCQIDASCSSGLICNASHVCAKP